MQEKKYETIATKVVLTISTIIFIMNQFAARGEMAATTAMGGQAKKLCTQEEAYFSTKRPLDNE